MMKTLLVVVALGFAGAASPVWSAEWSTSYGTMVLPDTPDPGTMRASYGDDEGRIIGTLRQPKCPDCGLLFEGIWVEAGSAERCEAAEDNSYHWGAVRLQFDPTYSSFAGEWDYCGSETTYPWLGETGSTKLRFKGGR